MLALGLLVAAGITAGGAPAGAGSDDRESAPFVEVAAETGLDFVYWNGMSGELYLPEMMGGGTALLDYDGDGDLDLFFVQGEMLGEGRRLDEAILPPPPGMPAGPRLYRNDLVPGGGLRFADVSRQAGLGPSGYGMGVAAGDFDNDGRVDLYLTNLGVNRLLRNRGDGTFEDRTDASGTGIAQWSVAALFFDYDRDGWLDLFVGNYVDFRLATHRTCSSPAGARDYCSPGVYPAVPDRLLHNRGDGTFEDVSEQAGLGAAYGPALGAAAADFDGDGLIDLYVANDGAPNQLWRNQGDGTFHDTALLAGCAVSGEGLPQASMGVVAADLDGDGSEDLFLTHLSREINTLYLNDGKGFFRDASRESGLANASFLDTGFGAVPVDVDRDGALDLFVANGAVKHIERQARSGDPYPLREPNRLFYNVGARRTARFVARDFGGVGAGGRAAGAVEDVSRGVGAGDLDNDGRTDLVVVNSVGPVRLLRGVGPASPNWLGLRLVGVEVERDMLGARVAVFPIGGGPVWRRSGSDGSYASAHDPRLLVGLGASTGVERVRVEWPSGRVEDFGAVPLGRYTTLREGTGEREADGESLAGGGA